jgi:SAM-dependent methyltransferase
MDSALQQRLLDLNRRFYDDHAEAFADTRPRLAPGILRVLRETPSGARVLELGCGDGKVGRWLARENKLGQYLGLDCSAGMLARAKRWTEADGREQRAEGRVAALTQKAEGASAAQSPRSNLRSPVSNLQFIQADLGVEGWERILPDESFDLIVAFAVLHHIPGMARRGALLQTLAPHLAATGRIVLSNWQFTREPRLARLIQPWATLGVRDDEVEPGDYLLAWQRGDRAGLRYVHLLAEPEIQALAATARLHAQRLFSSDGHRGQLSDYVALRPLT